MNTTIGSLFSGIGGLELGLERAGLGPTIWQVEKSHFCRRVLAKHWPNVSRYDDVESCDFGSIRPCAVLAGGFPCTDLSSAGPRHGLQGARSGVWQHFARAVDEIWPRVVIVENVTSGRRLWLPQVRRDLHVRGYDTRAFEIRAADVGAPHFRSRIFVVATDPARKLDARLVFHRSDEGARRRSNSTSGPLAWAQADAGARRVGDGLSTRLDAHRRERLKALGNAVVPQCAEVIGRLVLEVAA